MKLFSPMIIVSKRLNPVMFTVLTYMKQLLLTVRCFSLLKRLKSRIEKSCSLLELAFTTILVTVGRIPSQSDLLVTYTVFVTVARREMRVVRRSSPILAMAARRSAFLLFMIGIRFGGGALCCAD